MGAANSGRVNFPGSSQTVDSRRSNKRRECQHYTEAPNGDALRRDIGVDVRNVEAGFLPGEAGFREVLELLRQPIEYRGSELHLPRISHRKTAEQMGGGKPGWLPIRSESEPADHAHQAAARRGADYHGLPERAATLAGRGQARPGAIPASAVCEVRRSALSGIPGRTASEFPGHF